jgi:Protein of unknown function (DUF1761)
MNSGETMQPIVINWAAFAAAIAANFVLGGLWYSPLLFVRAWQAETGFTDQELGKRMPIALPGQLIASAVTAFVLLTFIRFAGANSAVFGASIGVVAWLGFTAMPTLGYVLYGSRKPKLSLIDNGYHLVGLVIMGAILGGWR